MVCIISNMCKTRIGLNIPKKNHITKFSKMILHPWVDQAIVWYGEGNVHYVNISFLHLFFGLSLLYK